VVELDVPGLRVKVKGESLVYYSPTKGALQKIHFNSIHAIILRKGIGISTNLILKAAKHQVPIYFLNSEGEIEAMTFLAKFGPQPRTRMEQSKAYLDERGKNLAKKFAEASILSRYYFIRYLAKNRSGTEAAEKLFGAADEIIGYLEKLQKIEGELDEIRMKIMSIEAHAAEVYFNALSYVIPSFYNFKGIRTKRPPKDPINATISYANNMVRNEVYRAVLIAGLDPFLGYLHTLQSGRPALVLDLAEEFIVPIAHLLTIKLATRKMLKESDFTFKDDGAVYLASSGREKVHIGFYELLNKYVKFEGRTAELRNIMLYQARKLGQYLRNERDDYTIFTMKF